VFPYFLPEAARLYPPTAARSRLVRVLYGATPKYGVDE